MQRSIVDFPQPLGPSRVTSWPSGTFNVTEFTAIVLPKTLTRFSTVTEATEFLADRWVVEQLPAGRPRAPRATQNTTPCK